MLACQLLAAALQLVVVPDSHGIFLRPGLSCTWPIRRELHQPRPMLTVCHTVTLLLLWKSLKQAHQTDAKVTSAASIWHCVGAIASNCTHRCLPCAGQYPRDASNEYLQAPLGAYIMLAGATRSAITRGSPGWDAGWRATAFRRSAF